VLILKGLAVPGFAVDDEAVVVVEVQYTGFWIEVLLRSIGGSLGRVVGWRRWGSQQSRLRCGNALSLTGGWGGGRGGLWAVCRWVGKSRFLAALGMTILESRGLGWCGGGLWGVEWRWRWGGNCWRSGGGRGRDCCDCRRGRRGDGGVGWRSGGRGGFGGGRGLGWEEVVAVGLDGVADSVAPGVRAVGVDKFVLGNADGLQERLREIGDCAGGFGFYVAADDSGEDARQGGAEIAGGEVAAGKEVGQLLAEFLGGEGLGFFLGVVEAEMGMAGDAGSAATAVIGEGEQTQGYAVLFAERGHKESPLKLSFWDLLNGKKKSAGKSACATKKICLAGCEA
jgi:hypothetical protein